MLFKYTRHGTYNCGKDFLFTANLDNDPINFKKNKSRTCGTRVDGGDVCDVVFGGGHIFACEVCILCDFSPLLLLCVNKIICHSLEGEKEYFATIRIRPYSSCKRSQPAVRAMKHIARLSKVRLPISLLVLHTCRSAFLCVGDWFDCIVARFCKMAAQMTWLDAQDVISLKCLSKMGCGKAPLGRRNARPEGGVGTGEDARAKAR